jgi:hypothetical protein
MIDALYRMPDTFDDQDGEGATLPALKDVGWVRTPTLQMPGTRPVGNFLLVHALVNDGLTAQEVEDVVAGDCLGARENDGNWLIAEDYMTLLDFMQDVDDIGTRPTNLNVMHIYSGRPWNIANDSNPSSAAIGLAAYSVQVN